MTASRSTKSRNVDCGTVTSENAQDRVDRMIEQWASERPDLDASPMSVIGRLHRLAAILDVKLRPPFEAEGLTNGDFDVLAALRRSGPPYRLTPTELTHSMVVTSGAITKRVDRLLRSGFVSRTVADYDGRGRLVELTPLGVEVVDRVVAAHWANEDALLAPLTPAQRDALAALLRTLLLSHE
jgi:DNA-binding MarR family transcriptional regulator